MDKKSKSLQIRNSTAEFLMFTSAAQEESIEVRVQDETVWLTQKMMQELYQCSKSNINGQAKLTIVEMRKNLLNIDCSTKEAVRV